MLIPGASITPDTRAALPYGTGCAHESPVRGRLIYHTGVLVSMSETTIPEENAPKCAVCSSRIVDYPTNRVIATATEDGTVEYKHFCGPSCESEYHT